jgi:phosphatidylglycerophosphatase A
MGSLAAIPIIFLASSLSTAIYLSITLTFFLIGIWICDSASKDIGSHDHGGIVWDEIVGMMITLAFVPISFGNLVLGFLLFRFFDILKPWPIRLLDRKVHGGFGIMLDDVVAGMFSAVILLIYSNFI